MQGRSGARQAAVLSATPPPAEEPPRAGLPPVSEPPADQRGDEFLEGLYRAHALALIRTAKLLLRDQPSAEDVVQDAFLNLYRALPRIGESDQILPYLRAAVINGSRSLLRKRRRAAPKPSPPRFRNGSSSGTTPPSPSNGPRPPTRSSTRSAATATESHDSLAQGDSLPAGREQPIRHPAARQRGRGPRGPRVTGRRAG
jgi:DNA-directed RNA polymerase specialized sigma24 family protein